MLEQGDGSIAAGIAVDRGRHQARRIAQGGGLERVLDALPDLRRCGFGSENCAETEFVNPARVGMLVAAERDADDRHAGRERRHQCPCPCVRHDQAGHGQNGGVGNVALDEDAGPCEHLVRRQLVAGEDEDSRVQIDEPLGDSPEQLLVTHVCRTHAHDDKRAVVVVRPRWLPGLSRRLFGYRAGMDDAGGRVGPGVELTRERDDRARGTAGQGNRDGVRRDGKRPERQLLARRVERLVLAPERRLVGDTPWNAKMVWMSSTCGVSSSSARHATVRNK